MIACAACGQENPDGFKFCGNCGAPLAAPPVPREVRKVVTVVFCDLTGSTALGDGADPETLRATMRGYYERMRTILERHGGTVEKFIGDAVMAVFGVPVAREDDALRAVRAAWEMRDAVPKLGLAARIGVNTGEVVAGEGDTLVTGDAVNVAARLEQAAEPGEVLLGPETRRLVRDAIRVEPAQVSAKGKSAPLDAFRLLELDPDAAGIARRLDAPLVGRRSELGQLRQAFDRTVREQRCHLFTLLGTAGVGKSRLVREFLAGVDATVVEGRCLDYGEGITFWPVVSILKQLGTRGDEALTRVAEGASSANELFWSVRAALEEVAADHPLVVVFDDIQWGEPTFLDLVDHVADLSRGAPILLLCVARPELLDKRPDWGGGKLNATTILLEPLAPDESVQLIDGLGGVPPGVEERILAAAGGNPLFVEEMIALVREDGDVRVPSTVHALLQARLDQLGHEERSVIERGAVEGQIFHRGAVLELTRAPSVEAQLAGLVRKELIHPARSPLVDERAFQFRHLLIRDAAYDALPKETRAELHARFSEWLEEHGHDLIELDEVLGYHLEQAARYRRELGKPDAPLEHRAALRLGEAGSKAALRSDASAAANLIERALALLPADDPRRARLLIDLIQTIEGTAPAEQQLPFVEELEQSRDRNAQMHGRIARLKLRLLSDPAVVVGDAEALSEEAIRLFTETGDDLGLAHAYHLIARINWILSRARESAAAHARVLEHAGRAGARVLAAQTTIEQIGPLIFGPVSREEISARIERFRESDSVSARIAAASLEAFAVQREGRTTEALALVDEVRALHHELGQELGVAIAMQIRAEILLDAERFDDAAAAYRDALAKLETLGLDGFRSTTSIMFGEALYGSGHRDAAERAALEGEALGTPDDVINSTYGPALRARIAADRGEHEEAERLARFALEQAYRTDFPFAHANAHESLAHVLRAGGRADEAHGELVRAIDLWQRYGYPVREERARALLVQL